VSTAATDTERHDPVQWRAKITLEKYEGEVSPEQVDSGEAVPYETIEREGNLLVIGGASALWERLIGTSITAFDNTNANLGVGTDSGTAAADTQTDLIGATKTRKAMDATYPQHSDSTSVVGAKTITYRSTFGTADANHAWNEWGVFNAAAAGRMLNRKVEALGTKTSAATWVLTVSLSLA
jgi:hypothetical protein